MQDARITLYPSKQRMQVQVDGILLADSTNTLELREHGYPPRHYFPREDVWMDLLTVSETTTCCPVLRDSSWRKVLLDINCDLYPVPIGA
tara:strand:- start:51 stop:320 length:270 start_codon:yes stop_codon:yes gene_type:complete